MREKLQAIPHKPGCYLMKDSNQTIIYVGKAKDLYHRVRSYFIGSHNTKTTKLVSQIVDFEYIITSSETEAFILEINLIKKHHPKYNILLMDDKTYPYICITEEPYSRLITVRSTEKIKGTYYGPYPNAKAAKEIVELLNKIYPLRKCRVLPKKECLYYHIGQCLAPCIYPISLDEYEEMKNKVHQILKGNVALEIKALQKKMEDASLRLEFEKAMEYRNLLYDLKVVTEKQKMETNLVDSDIFAYFYEEKKCSIQVFHVREGKILERSGHLYHDIEDPNEVFQEFIVRFYLEKNNPVPLQILISEGDKELLEDLLKHPVMIPKIGKNKELIRLVQENAHQKIAELEKIQEQKFLKTEGAIQALAKLINLPHLKRIEAFDNSNISGMSAVSAMVVFIDGKPVKKEYRKFLVKTVVGANDVKTMEEVIFRRYKEEKNQTDLIIVDGGANQIQAAYTALQTLNRKIPVAGLIKDEHHRTRALLYEEQIFELDKSSFVFRLLEKIQDEVHRYAIHFFHQTHQKNTFLSKLDDIKGVGKVKKAQILAIVGREDFEEELTKLPLTSEQKEQVKKIFTK